MFDSISWTSVNEIISHETVFGYDSNF